MNAVCVSGYTTGKMVNGESILRFAVVASHGYNKLKGNYVTEHIPCCLYNPSKKLRGLFNKEGLFLKLRGRISSSRYVKDGEIRYSTQVIVDPASIRLVR